MNVKTVLFLCTGNYYRSRFAEHVFNDRARKGGLAWRADSRGLALERGTKNVGPISATAAHALEKLDIALDGAERMPRSATESDFADADRVIALDETEHRSLMDERFPTWSGTVEYWLVHDLDRTDADSALAQVHAAVVRLLDDLDAECSTA